MKTDADLCLEVATFRAFSQRLQSQLLLFLEETRTVIEEVLKRPSG